MSKSYYQLYMKYKNKYLFKKNQIGSSSSAIPKKYTIPSEISNYTEKLLISDCKSRNELADFIYNLLEESNILDSIEITRITSSTGFLQDPYIILKDMENNDYLIKITNDCNIYGITNIDINSSIFKFNGNHYGGNYISSPNNKIFTFDKSEILANCVSNILFDEFVPLECSFNYNEERHIDEAMCFMPYGKDKFKVWFYYIRNISFNSKTQSIIDNLVNIDKEEFKKKIEEKANIFENMPQRINRFQTKQINNKDLSNELKKLIESIDNISLNSQLNYELLSEKKILTRFSNNIIDYIYYLNLIGKEQIPNLENVRTILNDERERNLEVISNKLFDKSYENSKDNFVFFPLDLELEYNYSIKYRILNIPIFNRLIIEKPNKKLCIFSVGREVDNDVEEKLNLEKPEIKSYIDDGDFEFHTFNTSEFNYNESRNTVGGNLHCLIKNIY